MTHSRPAAALLPWSIVLELRAPMLVLLAGAWLPVAGLASGCDDVRLPAIVPDGGTGAAGAGGEDTGSTTSDEEPDHPDCAPPTRECDSACYDVESSNQHCGECNKVCSGGSSCAGGECVCPADETECEGLCVYTQTDPQNCGRCGTECSSGVCSGGECEP
jgi:hypothetical protein